MQSPKSVCDIVSIGEGQQVVRLTGTPVGDQVHLHDISEIL